jgi:hypothetical protein
LIYRPILEKIGKFPVSGIVVCKHLLPNMPVRVARTLDEARARLATAEITAYRRLFAREEVLDHVIMEHAALEFGGAF